MSGRVPGRSPAPPSRSARRGSRAARPRYRWRSGGPIHAYWNGWPGRWRRSSPTPPGRPMWIPTSTRASERSRFSWTRSGWGGWGWAGARAAPRGGPPPPGPRPRAARRRRALVSASLRGRPLSAVIGDIQAGLRDVALPPGYTATFGGEAQFQTETFGDMLFALALGSLFVFMTIAVQFDSLAIPVIIMASVPLASLGTFLMLLLPRPSVSLMSLLGIIMLAGIVVNNAILLVEFVVQRRKKGIPRNQAILDAARTRLRPILMTALVSIMGGLPLAL